MSEISMSMQESLWENRDGHLVGSEVGGFYILEKENREENGEIKSINVKIIDKTRWDNEFLTYRGKISKDVYDWDGARNATRKECERIIGGYNETSC